MTTQLPERLRALADEAPEVLYPDEIWNAGTRRHRVRLVTSLAVAATLVAAAALLGYGDWQSRRPDPAAPPPTSTGRMAIPDRFFEPSPWLSSTGRPGRLVAIISATRAHFPWGSSQFQIVGVASGSQRYSFVDLPDRAPDTSAVLSPDGLHLAYWLAATPHDNPVAVGILDLTSGRVERHPVFAPHRLFRTSVLWTGDSTLAVEAYWIRRSPSASAPGEIGDGDVGLTLGSGRLVPLPRNSVGGQGPAQIAHGFVTWVERSLQEVDPLTGDEVARIRLSHSVGYAPAVSDDATRVAALRAWRPPGRLVVARVRHGRADLRPIPRGRRYQPDLAWSDDQHVIAFRTSRNGLSSAMMTVDVRTGRERFLSKVVSSPDFAAEALQHPVTVRALPPQQPWNPRPLAAWSLVALALLGWGAFLVRWSRVRR